MLFLQCSNTSAVISIKTFLRSPRNRKPSTVKDLVIWTLSLEVLDGVFTFCFILSTRVSSLSAPSQKPDNIYTLNILCNKRNKDVLVSNCKLKLYPPKFAKKCAVTFFSNILQKCSLHIGSGCNFRKRFSTCFCLFVLKTKSSAFYVSYWLYQSYWPIPLIWWFSKFEFDPRVPFSKLIKYNHFQIQITRKCRRKYFYK